MYFLLLPLNEKAPGHARGAFFCILRRWSLKGVHFFVLPLNKKAPEYERGAYSVFSVPDKAPKHKMGAFFVLPEHERGAIVLSGRR